MKTFYYFDKTRSANDQLIVQSIYGKDVLFIKQIPSSMLDDFEEGDLLIFSSVVELTKDSDILENVDLIVKEYMTFYQKGIELQFDKSTQCNTLFVRSLISSKQSFENVLKKCILNFANQKDIETKYSKRPIITAQLNGTKFGIKKGTKLTTKKSIEMKAQIKKLSKDFDGVMTDPEVMDEINLSRNTFYKYKRELKYENESEIKD